MTGRLLLLVLLLLPLGCAEGTKPSPLKRSGAPATPPAEPKEAPPAEKSSPPAENKLNPDADKKPL